MKMLPFTELDWDCYAGCEDKNPMISDDVLTIDLDGCSYVGQVIVDGFHVVIHINLASWIGEDEDKSSIEHHPILNEEMTIINEHMTRGHAIEEATAMSDKPTIDWLFLRGFKLV